MPNMRVEGEDLNELHWRTCLLRTEGKAGHCQEGLNTNIGGTYKLCICEGDRYVNSGYSVIKEIHTSYEQKYRIAC